MSQDVIGMNGEQVASPWTPAFVHLARHGARRGQQVLVGGRGQALACHSHAIGGGDLAKRLGVALVCHLRVLQLRARFHECV